MCDGIDAAVDGVEDEDHDEEDILVCVSVEAHHDLYSNITQVHSHSTQQ